MIKSVTEIILSINYHTAWYLNSEIIFTFGNYYVKKSSHKSIGGRRNAGLL